ncbi:MAG UNVERIFIED_CONTAM: hypothetical protein LVR18_21235 [Planctomycetaceae bacterium]
MFSSSAGMCVQELVQPAARRPMSVEDLFAFRRVGSPAIDPSGRWVVYPVTEIIDSRANKSVTRLWVVPADLSSPARQLTNSSSRDTNPRWSPDGRWILFESNRSGSSQLWIISSIGGSPAADNDQYWCFIRHLVSGWAAYCLRVCSSP